MKDTILAEDIQTTTKDYKTERNKPIPSLNHARIQANIVFLMMLNYRKKFTVTSELSLNLADWVSVPDIALLPWSEYDAKGDQIKVSIPPLCTIEILSPTQTQSELLSKARNYFENGVNSCWIIFPELENIYVFSNADKYQIFRKGDILNDVQLDITLNINDIFQ